MKLAFRIARKYFLSKNEKHFINIISILSMVTLAFGTAALFIILSVFNGLHTLISGVHTTFDPELTIQHTGKTFNASDSLLTVIKNIEGVKYITEVLEDDAFINYKGVQKVIHIKGVTENYTQQNKIDSVIKFGKADLIGDGIPKAVIGRGIQYELGFSLNDDFNVLDIWYPKRTKKVIKKSEKSLNKIKIRPSGVFELERQYDGKYIFVPISAAQELFEYTKERTSIEIKTTKSSSIEDIQQKLQKALGNKYKVLNSDQLHSALYKAIKIERFITYLIFVFILILASLNIFLALTMIVISKKKDISILFAMGATRKFISQIFFAEGLIIGLVGTGAGLILGIGIVFLQEQFSLVGMDVQSAIVDAFPVEMEFIDILFTGITTLGITLLLSIHPALKASKFKFEKL